MKRFYTVKISYYLLFFFLGAILFIVSAVFGVRHAVLASSLPSETRYTVIIDAGHGGEDGGAVGTTGALEKDINLSIACLVQKQLENAGVAVEMIRDTDCSVGDGSLSTVAERKRSDIHYRAEFVNERPNSILVSVHPNFFEQSQYKGAQMFYSAANPDSLQLAEAIRSCITDTLQPENKRENKASNGIYLLDHVTVPAVIVECGFLSNPDEATLLCSHDYQLGMAEEIARGIIRFMERL